MPDPVKYASQRDLTFRSFDHVRKGDVVRFMSSLRKVRRVDRYKCGLVKRIFFAKLQRSGFPSPCASYDRGTIRQHFGGIWRRDVDLEMTELEAEMQHAVERWPWRDDITITEDDIVGKVI